jgi:hypothetical protein
MRGGETAAGEAAGGAGGGEVSLPVIQRIRHRVKIILRLWNGELQLIQKNDPEVVCVLEVSQPETGE